MATRQGKSAAAVEADAVVMVNPAVLAVAVDSEQLPDVALTINSLRSIKHQLAVSGSLTVAQLRQRLVELSIIDASVPEITA